jgi:hypothetical protein
MPDPAYRDTARSRMTVKVPNREAAQRQFWRHVANRTCLAVLADARYPASTPRPGTDSTRPPLEAPRAPVGSDVFRVRAEPIGIQLAGQLTQTQPLELAVLVWPRTPGTRLTLATLRDWPTPETTEPLFRYRAHHQTFERRTGLSGDIVYLFETLLAPHAAELLGAMGS